MADPLSITTGVVALVTFAGSTLTKGYRVYQSIQKSGKHVKQLLAELSRLTGILVAVEIQVKDNQPGVLSGSSKVDHILQSSISACRTLITQTSDLLDKIDRSSRVVLAARWQLLEPDVRKLSEDIEHNTKILILCLGVETK
ncbi:MAG: hypothetical protein MMC23_000284 [Stictis urceolatum]|nr:hypothetical protein [Stictis urceolata]